MPVIRFDRPAPVPVQVTSHEVMVSEMQSA